MEAKAIILKLSRIVCSKIPLIGRWQKQCVAQNDFDRIARLGHESPNPWIKKSAEIPGWLFHGEHEYLYAQGLAAPPGHFVEIGSLYGKSSCILSGALKGRGRGERLFAVDPFTKGGGQLKVPGKRPSSADALLAELPHNLPDIGMKHGNQPISF